ncbi:cell division protein FtsA [Nitratifractor sp.]
MSKTQLAVDIGSSKVCAVIAESDDSGRLTVTGHGIAKSQGVRRGVITNIELAAKAIKKAISDARRIAGNNIAVATVSISGAYTKSLHSSGVVNIPHKDITIKEIKRAMDTALYNANIPSEYDLIHVLPYNFRVDDQDFIEDPYGMNASRLEVDVNILVTQKSALSNLKKAVRSAGLEIEGIVLNGYASAIAVMGEDERELGVSVIDMGGQTSNLVVHIGNSIRYVDFLGVGSNHITNDLSMALHTPLQVAEKVKIRHGDLLESSSDTIELPVIGDEENRNEISLEIVHSVILARVEETLMILSRSLDKSGLRDQIGAGIVLTGGMTKLKGMRELAQAIFHGMPVRIGYPRELEGLFDELKDPAFSTVVGLLLYAAGEHTPYEVNHDRKLLHHKEEAKEGGLRDLDLQRTPTRRETAEDDPIALEPLPEPDRKRSKGDSETVEASAFQFDELVKPDKHREGLLNRIVNWAKQLF